MALDIPAGLTPAAHRLAVFDAAYFKVESVFNFISGLAIFGVMMLGVVQVVGRSVFNFPVRGYVDIVEIAITVFAFLGLAYCQRLNGHVRMEIIIGRFKGRLLWFTEIFGTLVAMFVVWVLMIYGWQHFMRAWSIGDSTMDIEIALWPSKLCVPFAFAMLQLRLVLQLIGFIRLAIDPDDEHQIAIPKIESVDEVAQHEIDAGLAGEEEKVVIVGQGPEPREFLTMSEFEIGIWGILGLLVMVFLGVRVFIAAALVGLLGTVAIIGWDAGAGLIGTIPHSKSVVYALSVLPMFILIGFIAYHAGLTHSLFEAAKAWFGWVPGGLAVASVFATAGFAAVSGASTATAAVFSRVAIPHMLAAGYDKRLAAGVVAAGGTLASLIPPSAILVIYAIIVEESVGALIIAGFLPGVVSALIYAILIVGQCVLKPELGRAMPAASWGERFRSLPGTIPIFLVVAIIFWAMMTGKATPTEAGALGAFIILVVAVYHGMRWNALRDALLETAKLTVMIFALIWGVLVFVRFLGYTGVPQEFAEWLTGLPLPPVVVMILILLGYAVLGMFMDAIGMLLLTLPVVYPAVIDLGYSPIWFGIIVVKMCEVCLITPPVGLNCYVVAAVRPDIPLMDVFRGIVPFFCADIATVGLFLAYPAIVTWLPDLMAVG